MCLSVNHLHKKLGRHLVVADNISFEIEKGNLGALIGPSGCGKTTLLRMIAGFEKPDGGRIRICGTEVASSTKNTAPEKRQTGMVFQDYALFPHLTVQQNITFGPVKHSKKEIEKLIRVTGLSGSEKKYPHELSGGQQQRVALARALAPRPKLLLMDEPFSNLDVSLRESLSEEVRFILNEYGITGLLVTHNQHEAFAMADTIGVMKHGTLLQWDAPDNLYYRPCNYDVARFVGEGSVFRGRLTADGIIESDIGRVSSGPPSTFLSGSALNSKTEGPVTLFIRPEDVWVDNRSEFKAKLVKSHFRGPGRFHTFELPSKDLITCLDKCPNHLELNREYGITVCKPKIRVFRQ